jgi:hypothetical protein
MRTVPELVFVNCCHLAARQPGELLQGAGAAADRLAAARPRFAAGVAQALIDVGVRCVIAAGWAVDDAPAKMFAVRFYEALASGARFIDAAALAREAAAREPDSNTWGAYQCYGDPDRTLRRGEETTSSSRVRDEFDAVASERGLELALETIVTRIKYQNRNPESECANIRRLQDRFEHRWGDQGRVAEGFGDAWAEAGERTEALRWYRRALQANDGRASLRCAQQIANIEVRLAWTRAADAAAAGGDDVRAAIRDARDIVRRSIASLKQLIAVETSMDRESLLGSAYKRLAMIEALAPAVRSAPAPTAAGSSASRTGERAAAGAETAAETAAEIAAIEAMRDHYLRAETLGREQGLRGFYYPALNRLSAELALAAGRKQVTLDPVVFSAIRDALEAHVEESPNFWNVVGQSELRVYEAMANGKLAESVDQVIEAHNDLQRRIGQAWMWASVSDSAAFVLSRYSAGASKREKQAARRLLDHLQALAE